MVWRFDGSGIDCFWLIRDCSDSFCYLSFRVASRNLIKIEQSCQFFTDSKIWSVNDVRILSVWNSSLIHRAHMAPLDVSTEEMICTHNSLSKSLRLRSHQSPASVKIFLHNAWNSNPLPKHHQPQEFSWPQIDRRKRTFCRFSKWFCVHG